MNRKQFLILLALVVVIGGAGLLVDSGITPIRELVG